VAIELAASWGRREGETGRLDTAATVNESPLLPWAPEADLTEGTGETLLVDAYRP
jgi:hypothetical protein